MASISLNHCTIKNSADSHGILRSRAHAALYQNRQARVIDLTTGTTVVEVKLDSDERIAAFDYPTLVTQRLGALKVWHLSSPPTAQTLDTDIFIESVKVSGMVLAFISGTYGAKSITIIPNVTDIKNRQTFIDDQIDPEAAIAICDKSLFYSAFCGGLKIISLDGQSQEEILEGECRDDCLQSLIINIDRKMVVGSSQRAIMIWDIASKILVKKIKTDGPYTLYWLNGNYLLGSDLVKVKVWDVATGDVLFVDREGHEEGEALPLLTLFNKCVYRVGIEDRSKGCILL
jgi:WD40 repeat protein